VAAAVLVFTGRGLTALGASALVLVAAAPVVAAALGVPAVLTVAAALAQHQVVAGFLQMVQAALFVSFGLVEVAAPHLSPQQTSALNF
jgi:hypothetical protein